VNSANWRLYTFFQIDLKVIKAMRSENFSFRFTKDAGKFVIFRRNIKEIRSRLYKVCRVSLTSEEQRQIWKLLEPKSFDIQKKVIILIIVVLGHSEIDTKVNTKISDDSIETIEFGEYKELSEINRVVNAMLAGIHSET